MGGEKRMPFKIAIFGEAEKGRFGIPYFCPSLEALCIHLGHPPPHSEGITYAIQAILYQRYVLFFRVEEEGFSKGDYFSGLNILLQDPTLAPIHALHFPKVGDPEILNRAYPILEMYQGVLLISEKDLFDYLTA